MNIQRYRWPVSIAAGLHGALLLSSLGTPNFHRPVHVHEIPFVDSFPPTVPFEQPETPSENDPGSAGGGKPVIELPEAPVLLKDPAIFTTDIRPNIPTKTEITTLTDIGRPVGPDTTGSELGGPAPFDLSKLDRVPRATVQRPPNYPAGMKQSGTSGSVTVEFVVDTDGHVVQVEAIRSTHREFVEPALRAVRTWQFEPGKRNGKPVRFRMAVPIEFSLDAS
jgi:protein TonB